MGEVIVVLLVIIVVDVVAATVIVVGLTVVELIEYSKPDDDPSPAVEQTKTTFDCPGCGSGPWHKGWGRFCPNCSGAD